MSLSILLPRLRSLENRSALDRVLENVLLQLKEDDKPDDFDKSLASSWLHRAYARCEEEDWGSSAEMVSLILLKLAGTSEDVFDSLERIFSFKYVSPFSQQSEEFRLSINDGSASIIGSQTWNSAPLLAQNLGSQPLAFFRKLLNATTVSSAPNTPPMTRPSSPTHVPRHVNKLRVLELGSGTGLGGLAAAIVLAKMLQEISLVWHVELILTDYQEDVLNNLRRNFRVNQSSFTLDPTLTDSRLNVHVEALDWSQPEKSVVQGRFDVILGSDLVYEEQHAYWAAAVVEELLARSPPRKTSILGPFTPPLTPQRSREASPSPLFLDFTKCKPLFHLLLPLRPTFLRESQAVHKAFNSRWQLSSDGLESMPDRSSRSATPVIEHRAAELAVLSCQAVEGSPHGQGCRDYQWLTIGFR